jgi:hypothetical protein
MVVQVDVIIIRNVPSLYLFYLVTPAARKWVKKNVKEDREMVGNVLKVERKFGCQAPGRCPIDPPAVASTGPTKPLRRSLTFRLRIRTNQGHLERAEWPDHSVDYSGRIRRVCLPESLLGFPRAEYGLKRSLANGVPCLVKQTILNLQSGPGIWSRARQGVGQPKFLGSARPSPAEPDCRRLSPRVWFPNETRSDVCGRFDQDRTKWRGEGARGLRCQGVRLHCPVSDQSGQLYEEPNFAVPLLSHGGKSTGLWLSAHENHSEGMYQ